MPGLTDPRRHRPGCPQPAPDVTHEGGGRWRIEVCGDCGAVDVALVANPGGAP